MGDSILRRLHPRVNTQIGFLHTRFPPFPSCSFLSFPVLSFHFISFHFKTHLALIFLPSFLIGLHRHEPRGPEPVNCESGHFLCHTEVFYPERIKI